jgi:selenocysteine-specific elongation factor
MLPSIKIYKTKVKEGVVDTLSDTQTVICRGMFSKETPIDKFIGNKVTLETGEHGVIEGAFGKSGKFNVRVADGLLETTMARLKGKRKKGKKGKGKDADAAADADAPAPPPSTEELAPVKLFMEFKKFMFDPDRAYAGSK